MKRSNLELLLEFQMKALSLPQPETEYKFHPSMRWRFDFAWPELMIAVEVEGGTYNGGRHTRGSGFKKDSEKYNAAVALGWRMLRGDSTMVKSGELVRQVEELLISSKQQQNRRMEK